MTEQAPLPRPTRREDYEPVVRALRPHCDGEELTLRTSLLLMRDRAVATKPIACESAWKLLDIVECEANAVATRQAPLDVLREVRRLCVMCVAHASSFDTLYQPRLPGIVEGEANARHG